MLIQQLLKTTDSWAESLNEQQTMLLTMWSIANTFLTQCSAWMLCHSLICYYLSFIKRCRSLSVHPELKNRERGCENRAGWMTWKWTVSLHVSVTTLALRWQQETHTHLHVVSDTLTLPVEAARSSHHHPVVVLKTLKKKKKERGKENPDFVLHSLLSLIVKNTFFSKGLTVPLTELVIQYRCSPEWDHILAPNLSFLPLLICIML